MSNRRRIRCRNGETIRVNVWRTIGGIILRDMSGPATELGAAALLHASGIGDMRPAEFVGAIRELHEAGLLDVDGTGTAFLTRPAYGPDGELYRARLHEDEIEFLRQTAPKDVSWLLGME